MYARRERKEWQRGWNSMGLSNLVLLGCTALMRANVTARNIHLDVCSLPKWVREWTKADDGMYARRERKERERGRFVHLCLCIA